MKHSDPTSEAVAEFSNIESIFIRERNCLLLRGDFSPIFTDYYLHLMDIGVRHPESLDSPMKDLLAVLGLHLCARPWAETIAWTANLRAPRVNYFATGSSTNEYLVGRLFTKDIREPDRNFLYSQTTTPGSQARLSTIEVETTDPLRWISHYYDQSEQRPGRAFRLPDDQYALVAAQPDYDEEWFSSLTEETVLKISEQEQIKHLESRRFQFRCGCSLERIAPTLRAWKDKPEELFGEKEVIHLECPRCSKSYCFSRNDLGNHDEKGDSKS